MNKQRKKHGNVLFLNPQRFGLLKAILLIAVPVALQTIISVGINMVDTLMVGALGETQLTAVSQASQLFFIFQLTLFGTTGGANVLIAQYWGKQDGEAIRSVIGYTFRVMLSAAAVLVAIAALFPREVMTLLSNNPEVIAVGTQYLRIVSVSYLFFGITTVLGNTLRAVGDVNVAMGASLASIGASVIFTMGLIIGGNLELVWMGLVGIGTSTPPDVVVGSALANILARMLECAILIVYSLGFEKKIRFRFSWILHPQKVLWPSFVKNCAPVVANELTWVLGSSVLTMISGHMAFAFATAYAIFNVVAQISCALSQGISAAASVVVGNLIGEGKQEELDQPIRLLQRVGAVSGTLACLFILAIIPLMPKFYNITPETFGVLVQIMAVGALIEIFRCMGFVNNVGILRGGGDARFVFFNDVFYLWVFCIPVGWWCSQQAGIPVFMTFFILRCDDVIKAFVGDWRIHHGQWIHQVTVQERTS